MKMFSDQINYSRAFDPEIKLASFSYVDISDQRLDSLKDAGVVAVFTGEVGHFYGDYDSNVDRQLLYAAPLAVLSGTLSFKQARTYFCLP